MVRAHGAVCAKLLQRRLTQLGAAETLAVATRLPQMRLHELKGTRKGTFAADLEHPRRLVLKPHHDPVPLLDDGGIDLAKVTQIRILSIEDYHGR
jgi:proteic killer suppression protein